MARQVKPADSGANESKTDWTFPGLVHPAFRHQKMEVDVEIDPVPESLEDGDDPGD